MRIWRNWRNSCWTSGKKASAYHPIAASGWNLEYKWTFCDFAAWMTLSWSKTTSDCHYLSSRNGPNVCSFAKVRAESTRSTPIILYGGAWKNLNFITACFFLSISNLILNNGYSIFLLSLLVMKIMGHSLLGELSNVNITILYWTVTRASISRFIHYSYIKLYLGFKICFDC